MGAFQSGFQMGQSAYQQALDNQQREREFGIKLAAEQRAQAEFDQKVKTQQAVDAAYDNYGGLATNGVVTGKKAGFSDASAAMLNAQGGQQAVDDAASYGNVEAARMGLTRPYQTSVGAAPTVQTRAAGPLELNQAMQGIARAERNLNGLATLQG